MYLSLSPSYFASAGRGRRDAAPPELSAAGASGIWTILTQPFKALPYEEGPVNCWQRGRRMGRGALICLRYIHAFTDRFGKRRYYFRRHGKAGGPAGAAGGARVYGGLCRRRERPGRAGTSRPASVSPWNLRRSGGPLFRLAEVRQLRAEDAAQLPTSLGAFMTEYGDRRVATMETQHVEAIIGKMADRPGAAIELLRNLKSLLNYGIKIGLRIPRTISATVIRVAWI